MNTCPKCNSSRIVHDDSPFAVHAGYMCKGCGKKLARDKNPAKLAFAVLAFSCAFVGSVALLVIVVVAMANTSIDAPSFRAMRSAGKLCGVILAVCMFLCIFCLYRAIRAGLVLLRPEPLRK
jgi:DNA-directed RNA polymerase subunit RPC12/RpoP